MQMFAPVVDPPGHIVFQRGIILLALIAVFL